MASNNENNSGSANIIQTLIVCVSLLLGGTGSYFAYQGVKDTNSSSFTTEFIQQQMDINESLQNRVLKLEEENSVLKQINLELKQQLSVLSFFSKHKRSEREAYLNFINSMPLVAWLKGLDENGDLRMIGINAKYTARYGITMSQYKDKTDYEVWPHEIADEYYKYDLEVLTSGLSLQKTETKTVNGVTTQVTVVKFRILLENGKYGVAGFIFP